LNSTVRLKIETFDGISMGANDSKKKSGPKPALTGRRCEKTYGLFSCVAGVAAGGAAGGAGGVK
jgi:hypothetical protein